MNKFILRQSLLLLIATIVWGVAFVAQSVGMDYVGPFTFLASRSYLGFVVLLPVISVMDRARKKAPADENDERQYGWNNKILIAGGIVCGTVLMVASSLQQIGIQYTSVGKAGFITTMYIIFVPLISIFLKKRAGLKVWISVIIAVAGLYLLCMTESIQFQYGDLMVLLCAVAFSFHILVIDHFSPKIDGVKMSCIQFLVCALLSTVFMFIFEKPSFADILQAWKPILYAGVMSSGVGYTLQIVGQRGMNATVAALIMSLESVVSVLAGFLLLEEILTARELFGCLLMFIAIVLTQLPEKQVRLSEKQER